MEPLTENVSNLTHACFLPQALGSFYFIHESLKNIQQFDFKAKKFKKVVGKETYSETLESTPSLEKEKFPQDYFPELSHTADLKTNQSKRNLTLTEKVPPMSRAAVLRSLRRVSGSVLSEGAEHGGADIPPFITVMGGDATADLWKVSQCHPEPRDLLPPPSDSPPSPLTDSV
ncbi:hypothetical protein KUCAC02_024196 [Chaenocephalus aceratus]|uniref:Uncharacterized protein n=1 Tax=Chaenocephalus aceratus TaxID=36190 RepID=A0ACB9WH31_CHAAC|nr:hypothetical protein KUCAC02_024196 [Chaenocephalus aceratus]